MHSKFIWRHCSIVYVRAQVGNRRKLATNIERVTEPDHQLLNLEQKMVVVATQLNLKQRREKQKQRDRDIKKQRQTDR